MLSPNCRYRLLTADADLQCQVKSAALRVLVQQHQHQGRQIAVARLRCCPSIEGESHVKQQADQNR
jgi:hypothetical protein